jgi:prepilin-type N-terminal cleavage/methylation domain-containing protein
MRETRRPLKLPWHQRAPKRPMRTSRRTGFTLVEVMVVSGLMTMLAMLLAATWSVLGKPLIEASAQARVAHEANLAVAALTRDFGGSLPGNAGRIGQIKHGKLVGRMQVANSVVRLCFDSLGTPNGIADWDDPDTVISYEVLDGNLVRWDEQAGTTFVVARHVTDFEALEQGGGVRIRLTFAHRHVTRSYTLIGLDP